MLFERIEAEGLAHYSYLLGDQREAVVIDPRRDCEVYLERASRAGYRITHVLETHRHEDFVVGSLELASRTGAAIWHADAQLDYHYGTAAGDSDTWKLGRFTVQALATPGHTPGGISYVVRHRAGNPWIVFTGDTLFAGEVGRTDLSGADRAEEMASRLYDSLFGVLLPLGDEVIVLPAHGAGSVCGSSIVDRPVTTIGIERTTNPALGHTDREDFVAATARVLERPPYFREVERLNIEGAPLVGALPIPPPLTPARFEELLPGAVVIDTRMELGFASAHIPGSLSIWLAGLPSFAGWFVPPGRPILLVNETDDPLPAVRHLIRLGYGAPAGHLAGGILAWHMAGKESASVGTVTARELCRRIDAGERPWILDARSDDERSAGGTLALAHPVHLTTLPERIEEVPRDRSVVVVCGSGLRSMTAASLMRREGLTDITVVRGGISGWSSSGCPLKR